MAFLQAFLDEKRKKELKQKLNNTDDYKFIKTLGQGAFGDACLLQNTKDGNKYVAKAMQITNEDVNDLAEREMATLKDLHHPNIVRYVDCYYDKNRKYMFIIMEFCAGGDLFDYITSKKKKRETIHEVDVWNWSIQIFSALEYMHGKKPKVLHRDLKPANIFLTEDKANVKLGDFGVSRSLVNTMDMATTLAGTPQYLSPELLIEQPYNHKADVWAAGCCVYELMTLEHATKVNWVARSVKVNPMPAGYSKELLGIVEKMLSLDPNQRPDISDILKRPFVSTKIDSFQRAMNGTAAKQVTVPLTSNGKPHSNSVFYNDNGKDDDDDNDEDDDDDNDNDKKVHNNVPSIDTLKIVDDKDNRTIQAAGKPRAQEPPLDSLYLIRAQINRATSESGEEQAEAAKYQEPENTYLVPKQRTIAALKPSRASEPIYDLEKFIHDDESPDLDRTYDFIDDMNETLKGRPPSSSADRYLPMGDIKRMISDKQSEANNQIRRIKTCSEDIRHRDPYAKLQSLGYCFNTDLELRYIKDGGKYDHARDGFKYEEICEAVYIYLSHILVNKFGMLKIVLPVDAVENEPTSFAYISSDALGNNEKLMILVPGSGKVMSGEWSRKLIINESVDSGSQIPWFEAAQLRGYGVIMANINNNSVEVEGVKNPIRYSEDPEMHMQCIWKLVSRGCQAKKIVFVAHSAGGNALLRMAVKNKSFLTKTFCIVFADSMHEHSTAAKDVSDELRTFLKEHSRNYIPHESKPVGKQLKKASDRRLSPTFSAGNVEHPKTCNNIIPEAIRYIEEEFYNYNKGSNDKSLLGKIAEKITGKS